MPEYRHQMAATFSGSTTKRVDAIANTLTVTRTMIFRIAVLKFLNEFEAMGSIDIDGILKDWEMELANEEPGVSSPTVIKGLRRSKTLIANQDMRELIKSAVEEAITEHLDRLEASPSSAQA